MLRPVLYDKKVIFWCIAYFYYRNFQHRYYQTSKPVDTTRVYVLTSRIILLTKMNAYHNQPPSPNKNFCSHISLNV